MKQFIQHIEHQLMVPIAIGINRPTFRLRFDEPQEEMLYGEKDKWIR